jgi:predicted amidohydrolase YtcJ
VQTRDEAVEAYTQSSAYAEFTDTTKRTLMTDKHADLAVLSQDVSTVPVSDLPKTNSVLTLVRGQGFHDLKVLDSYASAGVMN